MNGYIYIGFVLVRLLYIPNEIMSMYKSDKTSAFLRNNIIYKYRRYYEHKKIL